jgi:hypothetical protein
MIRFAVITFALLTTVARAQSDSAPFIPKNDWSKPCFNGECTWDLPAQTSGNNAGTSGSMKIVSNSGFLLVKHRLILTSGVRRMGFLILLKPQVG